MKIKYYMIVLEIIDNYISPKLFLSALDITGRSRENF